MSQRAHVNKTPETNSSLEEVEDQLRLSAGISNFKRPLCSLNETALTVKKKKILAQRWYVHALLSAKKPDHSGFGPLRVHLH